VHELDLVRTRIASRRRGAAAGAPPAPIGAPVAPIGAPVAPATPRVDAGVGSEPTEPVASVEALRM